MVRYRLVFKVFKWRFSSHFLFKICWDIWKVRSEEKIGEHCENLVYLIIKWYTCYWGSLLYLLHLFCCVIILLFSLNLIIFLLNNSPDEVFDDYHLQPMGSCLMWHEIHETCDSIMKKLFFLISIRNILPKLIRVGTATHHIW